MQQDVETKGCEHDTIELLNWLRLTQIPNFGVSSLNKLRKKLGIELADLYTLPSDHLKEIGFKPQQIEVIHSTNTEIIDISLNWLKAESNRFLIHFEHPFYPDLLRQISSPPSLLYGYGNPRLLSSHQIGMVGSRNPSPQGKENARTFAYQLSEYGWIVVSGLASGIDGDSHRGALLGKHTTIAVLGTAIDKMYPKRHVKLAEDILENNGVIISEFPPGTVSRPEHFPRRNRIISGLSLGTLIVEAAIKSGSLITARYALEQNREVFAVPGNIHNLTTAGCHYLIQQGAKLVTCLDDINEEFNHIHLSESAIAQRHMKKNTEQKSLASDRLLDSVDFEVTPLDIVAQRCETEVAEVMSKLLEYELRGLVKSVSGGYIKLGEK